MLAHMISSSSFNQVSMAFRIIKKQAVLIKPTCNVKLVLLHSCLCRSMMPGSRSWQMMQGQLVKSDCKSKFDIFQLIQVGGFTIQWRL